MGEVDFKFKVIGIDIVPRTVNEEQLKEICALDSSAFGGKRWGKAYMRATLDQALTILCVRGKRIIGCLSGRLYVSTRGVTFYINSVAVMPRYQRKGLGAQLLKKLESELRDVGVRYVTLFTLPESEGFYVRSGYVDVNGYFAKELTISERNFT